MKQMLASSTPGSSPTQQSGNVPIRYLGSKARLAAGVVGAIREHQTSHPVFDLFAGIGHISAGLASDHSVVAIDASPAAAAVLSWRLCSETTDASPLAEDDLLTSLFADRLRTMEETYAAVRTAEIAFIEAPSVDNAVRIERVFGDKRPGRARCIDGHSLVTGYFANAYFGVQQALEMDALLYGLRTIRQRGKLTQDEFSSGLVALLCAATHLTNGAGHFAQFFDITETNVETLARLRSRRLFVQWTTELHRMEAAGTREWRQSNRVVNDDSLRVLETQRSRGDVVYFADPPYTASQYSRFYHVLDTLVLYDLPACEFTGRYRSNRFRSDFCTKKNVLAAFRRLISSSIGRGGTLYLTYPSNGLLLETGVTVGEASELAGGKATLVSETELLHAAPAKVTVRTPVTEQLWRIHA